MDENPISYWNRATTKDVFPHLHRIHLQYFSSPVTTAEAERLFSSAKTVLTDNRKLLSAENFTKLMFLQQNVKLMGFGPQNNDNYSKS
uniref:Dimer_Tnp_hAT domain-containing protein n=1 Tax=Caenorhabditis japonica TaxID=281687 RepID=A0A8R1HQM2_CAEJA